jgi:hypothetical protein
MFDKTYTKEAVTYCYNIHFHQISFVFHTHNGFGLTSFGEAKCAIEDWDQFSSYVKLYGFPYMGNFGEHNWRRLNIS